MSSQKTLTQSQIVDKINDPRITNLGAVGTALVAAARKGDKR